MASHGVGVTTGGEGGAGRSMIVCWSDESCSDARAANRCNATCFSGVRSRSTAMRGPREARGAELDGVRVYQQGDHVIVNREEMYP